MFCSSTLIAGRVVTPVDTCCLQECDSWSVQFPLFTQQCHMYRRQSQMDVVYLSWPIAPSYMSPNAGGGVAGGLSQWVQLCTWSLNNFGDLTRSTKLRYTNLWVQVFVWFLWIDAANLYYRYMAVFWMRSSRVVRVSGCQCQSRKSPGFDPSILSGTVESEGRQMLQCWVTYI